MALYGYAAALLLAALLPLRASANDGFYQGAGYHLVPVKSTALRVVRERLRIAALPAPRCFPVLNHGKRIRGTGPYLKEEPDPRGFTLGAPSACDDIFDELFAEWSAEAVYEVEALDDAADVQIGFPVPTWDFRYTVEDVGLRGARIPAAAEFQTYVDGERISRTTLKELELPGTPRGSHRDGAESEHFPGWAWSASFRKGSSHLLRTTYVFGYEISNAFYPGSEYPEGLIPWFLWGRNHYSKHLRYFLTPMRTWADPAPEAIEVRLDVPPGIPATHFVPMAARPSCVDAGALYFRLEKQFPAADIHLTYPGFDASESVPLGPLQSAQQWTAWMASLGPGAKVACRLRDELLKTADASLRKVLGDYRCQESCEAAPTWPVDFPGAYPETSMRRLDPAELAGKTAQELRLRRNEIFARHGYRFRDKGLLAHFEKVPGYRPRFADVEPLLADVERNNVALLLAAEAQTATVKNETKCWSFVASYPRTKNPAIDEDLTRWVKGLEADFLEEAQNCTGNLCGRCASDLKFTVAREDAEFLSIAFEHYRYMGGAFPTIHLPHRTYLKPDGRRVQIGDLLAPQGLALLSQAAIAELQPRLESQGDPEMAERYLSPLSANFQSFTLTPDKLTVEWCAGCLFAHVSGGATVSIPLEKLKPYFRADLGTPAPSFACTRAETKIEKAICTSWRLAQADREMADQFSKECLSVEAQRAASKRGASCNDLRADQAAWLKQTDRKCGDVPATAVESCLMPLMEARAKALSNWGYEHSKP